MKIYTKQGDGGQSSLIGGEPVPKFHERLHAYGSLDELNSLLGVVRSQLTDSMVDEMDGVLLVIQNHLFSLGSHLACAHPNFRAKLPTLDSCDVAFLEEAIDKHEEQLPPIQQFILPGGHVVASQMHMARTVCRRAERESTKIEDEMVYKFILPYLNRLSDLLYVLARRCNSIAGQEDIFWKK